MTPIKNEQAGTHSDDVVDQSSPIKDDGLYDISAVCRYFGGDDKPLHVATIYRGMNAGRYPKPVRISPNCNRWLGSELKAARTALFDARQLPTNSR